MRDTSTEDDDDDGDSKNSPSSAFEKDEKSGHRTNQRRAARNIFRSNYDIFGLPIRMLPYLYVIYYFWKFGDMHSRDIHQMDIQNLPDQEAPGVAEQP